MSQRDCAYTLHLKLLYKVRNAMQLNFILAPNKHDVEPWLSDCIQT